MITNATVVKTDGNTATVRALRKSACEGCEGCSDKGKCHAEILFSDSPKSYELDVCNEIGAKAGDVVEIQSSGNFVLVFALIVFILPVIAAILSYITAYKCIDGHFPLVISAVSFIAVFLVCAFLTNKLAPKYSQNQISKIIKENSEVAVYTNAYKE